MIFSACVIPRLWLCHPWCTVPISQTQAGSTLYLLLSWRLFHGTSILKMLGSPLQLRCIYTDRRFRDSDPATLCQTPASLHDLLSPAMEADLHQWPLLAPHNAKPQLLFMTPSCLQNQYQWETLTHYQVSLQARGITLAHTNYSFYLLTLRKHFSEDFSSVINHSQFLSPR